MCIGVRRNNRIVIKKQEGLQQKAVVLNFAAFVRYYTTLSNKWGNSNALAMISNLINYLFLLNNATNY